MGPNLGLNQNLSAKYTKCSVGICLRDTAAGMRIYQGHVRSSLTSDCKKKIIVLEMRTVKQVLLKSSYSQSKYHVLPLKPIK